jgi:DNA-binding MarR family transcriptional regulator
MVRYLTITGFVLEGTLMTTPDQRHVIGQLMHLQGLLRRQVMRPHGRSAWADPRQGQGRVLALLLLAPEMTQKNLVFLLNMSKQAVGEVVGKLEQRGFIERQPSPSDRRQVIITLTDAGRSAAESAAQSPENDDHLDLLDVLDDEEMKVFSQMLSRLIAHLRERLGDDDFDERRQLLEEFWRNHESNGRDHGDPRLRFGFPGFPGHRGDFPPFGYGRDGRTR